MRTISPRIPVACLTAIVALFGGLLFVSEGRAKISDALCSTHDPVFHHEFQVYDSKRKRDLVLSKVYVFREGSTLCAVTTSVGTEFDGVRKRMKISLGTWSRKGHFDTETDDSGKRGYTHYAGRIRRKFVKGSCFNVAALVDAPGYTPRKLRARKLPTTKTCRSK